MLHCSSLATRSLACAVLVANLLWPTSGFAQQTSSAPGIVAAPLETSSPGFFDTTDTQNIPSQSDMSSAETLSVYAGEVFEILTVDGFDQASYSWVLTRDGSFIAASRTSSYRYRFIEQGTYELRGDVTDMIQGTHRSVVILIQVGPPVSPDVGPLSETTQNTLPLISTEPQLSGTDVLISSSSIITVRPERLDIARMDIDINAMKDSNGDGNTFNDPDTEGTLFPTERHPLRLWLANDMSSDQTLTVFATLENGALQEERFYITQGNDVIDNTSGIVATVLRGGMYVFSLPNTIATPGNPLLIEWSFGDGSRSLLETPEHQYAQNGSYTVQAHVRSLLTGRTVSRSETVIAVSDVATGSGSVTGSESSVSSAETSADSSKGVLGNLWFITKIILIILAIAIAFGLLLWAVIRLIRKGKSFTLSDTFEKMETAVLDREKQVAAQTPSTVIDVAPPPLTIRRNEEPVAVPPVPSAPETPKPKPTIEPTIDRDNAPPWLKEHVETPAPKPEPTPLQTPSIRTPVTSTPVPPPPVANVDTENAPAWLKEGLSASSTKSTSSAPTPPPAPAPASKPVVKQKTDEAPVLTPSIVVSNEPVPPPTPEPIILTEQSASSPLPVQTQAVPQTSLQNSPDADERERERKRRKRQRYRDNLKRRQEQNGQSIETEDAESNNTLTESTPKELSLPPAMPEHELPAPKADSPVPPAALPVANTPVPSAESAPLPPTQKPTNETKSDTDIAFMIRADSIEPEAPQPPPATPADPAGTSNS